MKYLIDRVPGNIFKLGRKFLVEELEENQWLNDLGTDYDSRIRTPALAKILSERWQLSISTGDAILEIEPGDIVFIVLPLIRLKRGIAIEPSQFPIKLLKLRWVKSAMAQLT